MTTITHTTNFENNSGADAVKPWEELTPEEQRVWVAEKIMGWPVIQGHEPFRELIQFGGYIFDGWPERFTGIGFAHKSFTPENASDDFLVLNHVRKHWSHEENRDFVESLKTIRWPRCDVSMPFSLELYAEPGDYSHAAYLTLCDRNRS